MSLTISLVASAHVILNKRETRAAIGWVGLIWLSPFVGSALYLLLGINRINRKAHALRRDQPHVSAPSSFPCTPAMLKQTLTPGVAHLEALVTLVDKLVGRPLTSGNRVEPLRNGDEAYPAMLGAIDEATRSVALSTYIFNDDPAGRLFLDALKRAVDRGVAVRVLVDDIGVRYDWPTILGPLRRSGVPVATFIPTLVPWWFPYFNLRNHRKLLVVDGRIGFTGGINIDGDYVHANQPRRLKEDLHFRVLGPEVANLMRVFVDDWVFCTGEMLEGDAWFPAPEPAGEVLARGIPDGPDADLESIRFTLLGALAVAQQSVAVVTPYFLPDAALISALNVAAMRGVAVDILIPRQNNLRTVQWASMALLWQLLERGCRVWQTPPPFDHSKLMVVDRAWAFVGSANWDARSLRLNFEFNLECYHLPLASALDELVRDKITRAHEVTFEDVESRSLLIRLRDGIARMFSPYL